MMDMDVDHSNGPVPGPSGQSGGRSQPPTSSTRIPPPMAIPKKASKGKKGRQPKKDPDGRPKSKKRGTKKNASEEPINKITWHIVKPPPSLRKPRFVDEGNARNLVPRVWAEDQSELLAVIQELAAAVDGVSWSLSETPLILLEGSKWPQDRWQDHTTFSLTFVREFEFSPSATDPSPESIKSDPSPSPPYDHNSAGAGAPSTSMISQAPVDPDQAQTDLPERHPSQMPLYAPNCPQIDALRGRSTRDASPTDYPVSHNAFYASSVGSSSSMYQEPPRNPACPTAVPSSSTSHTNVVHHGVVCPQPRHFFPLATPAAWPAPVPRPKAPVLGYRATIPNSGNLPHQGCSRATPERLPNAPTSFDQHPQRPRLQDRYCSVDTPHIPEGFPPSSWRNPHQSSVPIDHPVFGFPGAETLNATSSESGAPPAKTPEECHIEKNIPNEIQALVDSYEHGIPVVVIMSKGHSLLPLPLNSNYCYSFMGYFRLLRMHTERAASEWKPHDPAKVYGRMTWRFLLSWASGGEDFLVHGSPLYPWWEPFHAEILPPYAMPNFKQDLKKYYTSYLPCQIHEPFDLSRGDFPRGWLCACGRLNEQIYLHHRRCPNCQDNPAPSLIPLRYVLDGQQYRTRLPVPDDHCPDSVEPSCVIWSDGVRTHKYTMRDNVVAKHIFAINTVLLEEEPAALFHDIQKHVELLRERGDIVQGKKTKPEPYFSCLVGSGHEKNAKAFAWDDVPACLRQARDFLRRQRRDYGEYPDVEINKLSVLGEIAESSKQGEMLASKDPLTILCLGADVIFELEPKGGLTSPKEGDPQSAPMEVDGENGENGENGGKGEKGGKGGKGGNNDVDGGCEKTERKTTRAKKTKIEIRATALVVQLAHGDVLMLSGDDFECKTIRSGVTTLLIGS